MANPYKILEPTVISFSGGRTSAFMLYKVLEAHDMSLPDEAIVCFANTGKEDEATLKFVHDCETNWQIPIVWLEYQHSLDIKDRFKVVSYETACRNGEPFSEMIDKKQFLPNSVMRFCTTELKIEPINRYMKSIGIDEFETFAGIRADEPKRVAKLRNTLHAPLASSGITQADVQAFWKSNSFDLDLEFRDKVTPLGNCDLCFMKGSYQLASIVQQNPSRAIWWAAQEEKIKGRFSKDKPTYQQMIDFSKSQIDMFDKNEETIPCFCGD
jgi:3'-phosphoadenosine 5'-phosphosulfate sulfotransferase (PAPS reductase)/FAD synthetase